ncbi:hypothetical protein SEUCBS139899_004702 [Sporothrix eucalyptigena]|uniref:Cenp-o kinetochore centromere component n=1 Tax=Sporothrix eucalyptigena TaxID=1812306 RepID=A0ABP0D5E6_9PEZI
MASTPDDEIEQLREQAAQLRKQLQVQTSTLLSAESTRRLLSDEPLRDSATKKNLLKLCDAHDAHKQQSLYRAGASVTAFRVRDPDPNAFDGGRVLGLRFDVMMGAQFLRPYYVLLNRNSGQARAGARSRAQATGNKNTESEGPLRVHRHTVPPSIPLGGIATRYLGATQYMPSGPKSPDLYTFARATRRALIRYHNRLAVIGDLRRNVQQAATKAAADAASNGVELDPSDLLADVSGADAEAKQIRFDWADGRTGRLLLDDDGDIQKLVVIGVTGARDRTAARTLLAGEKTAMGLVQRMSGT